MYSEEAESQVEWDAQQVAEEEAAHQAELEGEAIAQMEAEQFAAEPISLGCSGCVHAEKEQDDPEYQRYCSHCTRLLTRRGKRESGKF